MEVIEHRGVRLEATIHKFESGYQYGNPLAGRKNVRKPLTIAHLNNIFQNINLLDGFP